MGARPSTFKRGGGFLNNVDAVITGYQFEVGDTVQIKKGDRKGEDFTPLSLVPSFRVDGADEDVSIRLLIGDAARFGAVSDDGLTLDTPEGQSFGANSEAGIFIASLCENGFPEDRLSDDDTTINFEPIVGTRVRVVNEVNAEKTKRQGKQVNKTTKKEYDRRDLKIAEVYEVADVKPAAKAKTPAKTTAKAPTKGNGKVSAASVKDTVEELATQTLLAILKSSGGSLPKAKLSAKVLNKLLKDPNRDAARNWLFDDANLSGIAGIAYDADDTDQVISLAE